MTAPSPWAAAYIGRPWIAEEAECLHRAAEVWRDRLGVEVPLFAAGARAKAARRGAAAYDAGGWQRVSEPQELDAVAMARGRHVCHVGVFVAPHHVLHCLEGAGTVLTPVSRLESLGYRVAGYHRWAP